MEGRNRMKGSYKLNTIELAKHHKLNTIELAKHHKEHCEGEECMVSLLVLRFMAEQCGVEFTAEEKELFI